MSNRKRNFKQLSDWYNPLTWFGQPSIPPPKFEGVSTEFNASGPDFFGKKPTESGFNLALKNEFVTPFTSAEKSVVSGEKSVVSGVTNVWTEAVNVGKTIEKDIKIIGTDIEDFSITIEQDAVKVFKSVENVSIKLYNITKSTVIFVEDNYKMILMGSAVYIGARFFNEVKQTKLII